MDDRWGLLQILSKKIVLDSKFSIGCLSEQLRRAPIQLGVSMALMGILLLVFSGRTGSFLRANFGSLPSFLSQRLYPDYFDEVAYSALFFSWSLPPAMLLIFLGALTVAFSIKDARQEKCVSTQMWNISFVAVASVGIVFRLRAYLVERSIWLDEAFLALNFRDKSLVEMLFLPLEYSQVAPIGFLASVKFATLFFEPNDLSLRLAPFVFGCLTILMALGLCSKLFRRNSSRLVFLLFICFSPSLIYYSQELKQYSAEVFATMLCLFLINHWADNRKIRDGVIGGIVVFLAIPGPFLLISVVFAVSSFVEGAPRLPAILRSLRLRLPTFAIWILFGLIHLIHLVHQSNPESRASTTKFWTQSGGFPQEDGVLSFLEWLIQSYSEFIWTGIGQDSIAIPGIDGPGWLSLLIGMFLLLGVTVLSRATIFALASIGLATFAAIIGVYPSSGRLWLYLVPAVAILLANILELNPKQPAVPGPLVKTLKIGTYATLGVPILVSLLTFGKPVDERDMRWLLAETDKRKSPDTMVVSPDTPIVDWYSKRGFPPENQVITEEELTTERFSHKQIWIVGTHYSPESVIAKTQKTHIEMCHFTIEKTSFFLLFPTSGLTPSETNCSWVSSYY